jgi:hypothetical protein
MAGGAARTVTIIDAAQPWHAAGGSLRGITPGVPRAIILRGLYRNRVGPHAITPSAHHWGLTRESGIRASGRAGARGT